MKIVIVPLLNLIINKAIIGTIRLVFIVMVGGAYSILYFIWNFKSDFAPFTNEVVVTSIDLPICGERRKYKNFIYACYRIGKYELTDKQPHYYD
jgi:hypothetical protein